MSESLIVAKQRDMWFDNAKGFLMITVVIGHLITNLVNTFEVFAFWSNYIYFFHMPAFAFLSGYLLKGRIQRRDYVAVINKTFVPYLAAQVLIYLCGITLPHGVTALSVGRLYYSGLFSALFPIYHLWYFWGIIIAFVFCIIVKAEQHPVRAFLISVVLSLVSGFPEPVELARLSKVLGFLPFFVLGAIFTKPQIEFLKNKKLLIIPALVVIASSGICIWNLREEGSLKFIFGMNTSYWDYRFDLNVFQALGARAGFIAAAILMTFAILALCPKIKTPLAYLGKNSMYIYVLHVIPIAIMRHYHYETQFLHQLTTPWSKVLFVACGLLLCFILSSKPIVKAFKPIFEPNFDIRKIGEYLKINK